MDENKNSTPESTPEENNIKPAQPEANTAGPGEGKNNRSLRNTILTCISIALVLFAAIIVLRQYVYLPGKYEAPPTPAVTETPVATPEPTPYVKKIPVMMYFTGREISFPVETVGIVPYTDSKGREVKAEDGRTPQRDPDGKKPSIRAQLKADRAQSGKPQQREKEQEAKRSIRLALEME